MQFVDTMWKTISVIAEDSITINLAGLVPPIMLIEAESIKPACFTFFGPDPIDFHRSLSFSYKPTDGECQQLAVTEYKSDELDDADSGSAW